MRHVLLPLLFTACITETNYGDIAGSQACDRIEECSPSGFDAMFADQEACMATTGPALGGTCYQTHCETFDTPSANECVSELRKATCEEDSPAACRSVWSDCADISLGACLLAAGVDGLFE